MEPKLEIIGCAVGNPEGVCAAVLSTAEEPWHDGDKLLWEAELEHSKHLDCAGLDHAIAAVRVPKGAW